MKTGIQKIKCFKIPFVFPSDSSVVLALSLFSFLASWHMTFDVTVMILSFWTDRSGQAV